MSLCEGLYETITLDFVPGTAPATQADLSISYYLKSHMRKELLKCQILDQAQSARGEWIILFNFTFLKFIISPKHRNQNILIIQTSLVHKGHGLAPK